MYAIFYTSSDFALFQLFCCNDFDLVLVLALALLRMSILILALLDALLDMPVLELALLRMLELALALLRMPETIIQYQFLGLILFCTSNICFFLQRNLTSVSIKGGA